MSYDDDFGDCCYEAWRHGRNPDEISHDDYDEVRYRIQDNPEWFEFYHTHYPEEEYEN